MKTNLKFPIIITLIVIIGGTIPVFAQGESKTEAFFKIFSSGNYHMKAKITEGGKETTFETFVKGDQMASTMAMEGESVRVIQKDKKIYMIMDSMKMVMVTAVNSASEVKSVKANGMKYTGSGTAVFNKKSLPYDEYSSSNGEKLRIFIDGANLAGIRNLIPGQTTADLVILALDQNIPNNTFTIPSGYQVQDMSSFGQ